jgi:hypothetical protein
MSSSCRSTSLPSECNHERHSLFLFVLLEPVQSQHTLHSRYVLSSAFRPYTQRVDNISETLVLITLALQSSILASVDPQDGKTAEIGLGILGLCCKPPISCPTPLFSVSVFLPLAALLLMVVLSAATNQFPRVRDRVKGGPFDFLVRTRRARSASDRRSTAGTLSGSAAFPVSADASLSPAPAAAASASEIALTGLGKAPPRDDGEDGIVADEA